MSKAMGRASNSRHTEEKSAAAPAVAARAEPAPGRRWTPNQQAARSRIASAAAGLVARSGLAACTIRAVAEESGLPKSTVHYYVADADELVDLAVLTSIRRFADHATARMDAEPDGEGAFRALVRAFLASPTDPATVTSMMLWTAYTAHAWPRGARDEVLACSETIRVLFESALDRCGVPDAGERARAVHLYLIGAVQHSIVQALPDAEVAKAVSALSGVSLAPG
ncbi:TetR family transcriptional regulator [Yinghuangia sp. ASG 101]|uniref:TetR/AcrR family transcriptional regulator n=1 Tax=Yinghuangia sp. ASG 101 TaxID=2896848 RepID=UPI001E6069DD|nr:TetR family transcriptional regulator [Yinghuangia sp. ASG 101]UGQ11934.1 TetR family transcriptional regulator [Yinghuangia sp. ASG 101]